MAYPDLRRWPPVFVGAASLALIVVVGLVDYWTGPEISASVFYLAPVGLAAWYAAGSWGRFVTLVSAAVWYLADMAAGHTYGSAVIPMWNALVRLVFFLVVEELLRRLRVELDKQQRLAETDARTGLANARRFQEAVESEVARVRRASRPLSLAYLDLDDFKRVNDRFGHAEGDRVLESVAACMRANTRGADLVARLGGDEFAVLLPETDQVQAREVVEKLSHLLRAEVERGGWDVGFSVGVVTSAGAPEDAASLIRSADDLMYEVKRGGKRRNAFRSVP
jgi:diguanylate cyclase (GGDEF)-like protein